KHLVDEFSRFARMPVLTPQPTDVRQLIDGVASLYRESHPALSIETHHPDDLPLLEVDPDHIKRAVLNLVDNAVEAIGDSGIVRGRPGRGLTWPARLFIGSPRTAGPSPADVPLEKGATPPSRLPRRLAPPVRA